MTDIEFNPVRVREASWVDDQPALRTIRSAVFARAQGLGENAVFDEWDAQSRHFLAFIGERAVAGTRLTETGKIEYFGVVTEHRGEGAGGALMRYLLLQAPTFGYSSLELCSPEQSVSFFSQFGFDANGKSSIHNGERLVTMTRFLAPDRSTPASGEIRHFQYVEECRQHCIEIISQARKSICIFSESLDPALLNSDEMASLLIEFAKRSPQTSTRLLVRNSRPLKRQAHRLVILSQRADNILEIRSFDAPEGSYPYFYITTDNTNILFRSNEDNYTGSLNTNNRARVKAQQEEFDQLWNVAYTDPELRKLTL